jgi:hypothetical protein
VCLGLVEGEEWGWELGASGRGVRLGLVVGGEEWAPGTCVLEFSVQIHIPNSTRTFKLDRRETGATEVCVSSLDLTGLNLF